MSKQLTDITQLAQMYDPPSERITSGVLSHLMPFHRHYLSVATFFCVATGNADGLDASPRGGPPGFVRVLDDKHISFADWPGNNRIASLKNLVEDDRIGMLFLFPGLEVFMRINGHATINTDEELLGLLKEKDKQPKCAVVVRIDEVLFHCGKAINRAQLWAESSHIERDQVPSPGQIVVAMTGAATDMSRQVDEGYYKSIRNDLY